MTKRKLVSMSWLAAIILLLLVAGGRFAFRRPVPSEAHAQTLTVFAAASTTGALQEIAAAYEKAHAARIRLNFASSGTLARQLEAGAKADLFISADVQWMDYAEQRGVIVPESRRDLLGNRLVLIAPAGKAPRVRMERSFDLARALNGRLAVGDPDSVPAGRYAQQALAAMHWENGLRLLPCADVRAALAAVERGEVAAGIVYASDAVMSHNIKVIGEFPEGTHAPIRYPAALGKQAAPGAAALLEYLSGPEAAEIFSKYGFTVPPGTDHEISARYDKKQSPPAGLSPLKREAFLFMGTDPPAGGALVAGGASGSVPGKEYSRH